MKKLTQILSLMGSTAVVAGSVPFVLGVTSTNKTLSSAVSITNTDPVLIVITSDKSSLKYGEEANITAKYSGTAGNEFTWDIESGGINYVTLTNSGINQPSTAKLQYNQDILPQSADSVDIVVACTLGTVTKRVHITINPSSASFTVTPNTTTLIQYQAGDITLVYNNQTGFAGSINYTLPENVADNNNWRLFANGITLSRENTNLAPKSYNIIIRGADSSNSNNTADFPLTITIIPKLPTLNGKYLTIDLKGLWTLGDITTDTLNLANQSPQLTSLIIGVTTTLKTLNCNGNALNHLDVSNCSSLITLNCQANKLEELDVTKNTALKSLNCGTNLLTTLDVTKNTALQGCDCPNNSLVGTIDITKNTALTVFNCANNSIVAIDFTKNTLLNHIRIYHNLFTSIDLSKTVMNDCHCYDLPELTQLYLPNRILKYLYIYGDTKLTDIYTPLISGSQALRVTSKNEFVNNASYLIHRTTTDSNAIFTGKTCTEVVDDDINFIYTP